MRHLGRLAATGLALAVMVLAIPSAARAHARLVASDPPGGATLETAPGQVVLTFSERIETTFAGVQVFDPGGQRVEAGEALVVDTQVTVPLQPPTAPGTYTVVFRIVSGDSHPVESSFTFVYAPSAPPPSPSPEPSSSDEPSPSESEGVASVSSEAAPPPPRVELETAGPGTAVGLWATRAVNYLALTAVVGLLLAAGVLLANGRSLEPTQRRALRLAAVAALLWALTAAGLFSYGLSNAAARPLPEALSGDLPARFLATRFGAALPVQAVIAVAAAFAAALAHTLRTARAALALVAVGAFAPVWWGHAGTAEPAAIALINDWIHVAAVTVWVGGLAVLTAFLLRPVNGTQLGLAVPARRFSRLAGWALAGVLLTGSVNAVLNISAPGQLTGTTWGRLVLLKLALLAGIAALGWRSRTRLLPRLSAGRDPAGARQAFRRLALAEVGLMVLAFGAATGLASSIPAEAEAASRIASIASAFGDGQINLTIDPAVVGPNVMHLYYLDDAGRPRAVTEPNLTLTVPEAEVNVELFRAGPGHFTALSQQLPVAGDYQATIGADVDGESVTTTATLTIR